MNKQAKIRIVILFVARSTSYFLNLALEQKSLATPGPECPQRSQKQSVAPFQTSFYMDPLNSKSQFRGPLNFL
jgi:hypothetical protein